MKAHPIEFIKLGIIRTHYTYFSGSWDINAWAMNAVTAESVPNLTMPEYQRNMNLLRSISDILLGVLSGFGIIYVFMNVWRVLQSFFSTKRVLNLVVSVPFLNLAFLSAVFFVYEGQPRYNFITLFLLTMAFAIGFDMIREQMVKASSLVETDLD
jgi:FlaA1/EpsC-like NDP-sugar epimerase